ncbi:hypothetical protein QTP86_025887, partial [Hemibagrus guttatus]
LRELSQHCHSTPALPRLTSTLHSFSWTPDAKQAFARLKRLFTTAPILTLPDPSCQFVAEVDVSDLGVGAILSQWAPKDNRLHPCTVFPQLNRSMPSVNGSSWRLVGDCSLGVSTSTLSFRSGSKNGKPNTLSWHFAPDKDDPVPEHILPMSVTIHALCLGIEKKQQATSGVPVPDSCPRSTFRLSCGATAVISSVISVFSAPYPTSSSFSGGLHSCTMSRGLWQPVLLVPSINHPEPRQSPEPPSDSQTTLVPYLPGFCDRSTTIYRPHHHPYCG